MILVIEKWKLEKELVFLLFGKGIVDKFCFRYIKFEAGVEFLSIKCCIDSWEWRIEIRDIVLDINFIEVVVEIVILLLNIKRK